MACTVNVAGVGTLAGAVYTAVAPVVVLAVIVPTVELPPDTPLTVQLI